MVSRGNLRQAFGPYPYSFRATIHRAASKVSRIGYKVSLAKSKESTEFLVYEIDYTQTGTLWCRPRTGRNWFAMVKLPQKIQDSILRAA